ncbi:hypothetical protein JTE90_003897 [Oedothorax gibbosus]|uniref:Secreted protein n=1 Tax=Oedothorax gibbosus TaxID=931172 RepID=A0AAV6UH83_9ARAC|nr:hypothetical protein JTE90_003897 [Oedothorax gibbosus]
MKIVQTIILPCFLITYAIAKCGIQVQCPPLDNPTANCTLESDNSACPRCVCEYSEPKKPKHGKHHHHHNPPNPYIACDPPVCSCPLDYTTSPCPSCPC